MSVKISDAQIDEYIAQNYALGVAPITPNAFEFRLNADTRAILICLERVVTTVPAHDPLLPAVILSREIKVNNNIIVPVMTAAQYDAVIRSFEQYQPRTISNGLVEPKLFAPPLPKNTNITITLVFNTLALSTTTPAATCNFKLKIIGIRRKPSDPPAANVASYVKAIPTVGNVVADTSQQIQIGTDSRSVVEYLLTELTAGVLSDTCLAEVELLANSQRVMKVGTSFMKEAWRIFANAPAPAGYYLFKPPNPINPAQFNNIVLDFQMHTATPNAALGGWERYIKPV